MAGVDVGGTFTDLVLFDTVGKSVKLAKTPTTIDNQAFGVSECRRRGRNAARSGRSDRARHDDDDQRGAGTQAVPHRPDHHRRFSRRAGAGPPNPAAGLWHERPVHPDHPARPAAGSAPSAWMRRAQC